MIRSLKMNVNRWKHYQQIILCSIVTEEQGYTSRIHMCVCVCVLENFWSELPDTFLKTLLELFHTSASKMISKVTYDYRLKQGIDTPLHKSVQALQMVYKVNILYLKYGMYVCINE